MKALQIVPQADLHVYYEADAQRYRALARHDALQVVTQQAFVAYYRDCASIGFEYDGEPIGGVLFDGQQAHIAVLPAFRGRWAWLLRPALTWLFGLKAEIDVDVEADNAICIEFMRRNGWPVVQRHGHWIRYRMTPKARAPATLNPAVAEPARIDSRR